MRTNEPKVVKSIAMSKLFSCYFLLLRFNWVGLGILDNNDTKLGHVVLKQTFRKAFNSFNFVYHRTSSVAPKLN